MSKRFINCSACKGCHTGRGGRYCKFVGKEPASLTTGVSTMASFDPDAPDRGTVEYESYLSQKIAEEEDKLQSLKDKCRVTAMEEQLAQLRLQSAELTIKQKTPARLVSLPSETDEQTGVASQLLSVLHTPRPGTAKTQEPAASLHPATLSATFMQRSKEEKEMLSKLKALNHLNDQKPAEKVTYRDFICAMTKVLQLITELEISPQNYINHMSFIASKAATNSYATDALIKYEEAVTDRVITGRYEDWVAADPECLALHLGPDATYAIRQGGSRWSRQSPGSFGGNFGSSRDFSDWPKEVCWLYNNTSCYFARCKKAHICVACKRTGHTMKDCKNQEITASPSAPEVPATKTQKEARKA